MHDTIFNYHFTYFFSFFSGVLCRKTAVPPLESETRSARKEAMFKLRGLTRNQKSFNNILGHSFLIEYVRNNCVECLPSVWGIKAESNFEILRKTPANFDLKSQGCRLVLYGAK